MSKSIHTPTPYRTCGKTVLADCHITGCELNVATTHMVSADPQDALGNAEFIMRACNAHDGLVAACNQVLKDVGDRLTGKTVLMLRAAIAKANGTK